jgi:L-cysteine:1D-myo-inositol 2-amino-2-deoxy-alpha-D-glucopyranoside ligase
MSAAHAQSATGVIPFARTFMHTGMVWLDGHKMSKSLGNLVFVSTLTAAGVDPMAIRLAILAHHYREEWEWTSEGLDKAIEQLGLWRAAFAKGGASSDHAHRIAQALANDLDTPTALALVDEWATDVLAEEINDPTTNGNTQQMTLAIDALLGIQ